MKQTLLEMVTDILNDLDSDQVNSINDTVESMQVAQIIKSCYLEIISNRNWPHLRKLIQLNAANDLTKPNYLVVPDNVKEVITLQYDTHKVDGMPFQYRQIPFKNPDDFLRMLSFRRTDDLDKVVIVQDYTGVSLAINRTSAPAYYTSFDDKHIVFDAFDSSIEATVQAAKSQALVYQEAGWSMVDEFVPNLPSEAFSALLEESKSTAFLAIKQMANQKAEQKAKRQQTWLSRKAWTVNGGIQYPNYGRKGRK